MLRYWLVVSLVLMLRMMMWPSSFSLTWAGWEEGEGEAEEKGEENFHLDDEDQQLSHGNHRAHMSRVTWLRCTWSLQLSRIIPNYPLKIQKIQWCVVRWLAAWQSLDTCEGCTAPAVCNVLSPSQSPTHQTFRINGTNWDLVKHSSDRMIHFQSTSQLTTVIWYIGTLVHTLHTLHLSWINLGFPGRDKGCQQPADWAAGVSVLKV